MKKVKVSLKERSYNIVIGRGALEASGKALKALNIGRDAFVITNARIAGLYGAKLEKSLKQAGFSVRIETVPDSEKAKSIAVATRILNRMSAYDVGKKLFVAAFGGGVIGDLAGFVAAVYKRGIPYVQIPTTLLAQVDSSIGGKSAVDLPAAKNLVGAFHQPKTVLADVSLIGSLPLRQIRSGLAEVIKYGVISDPRLFRFLEINIRKLLAGDAGALEFVVSRCAAIKAGIVAKDELDRKGVRAILNYGHTIGHAIEAASSYSGQYNHGEAIAIGMIAANSMSVSLGLMKRSEEGRIEALIKKAGLPTGIKGLRLPAIYACHLHDKKFTGATNRFILPIRIGAARIAENVPDRDIRNALKERSCLCRTR
jgi:3-dehydroquinate synthase